MARNDFAIEPPRKIKISIPGYQPQVAAEVPQPKQKKHKRRQRKQRSGGAASSSPPNQQRRSGKPVAQAGAQVPKHRRNDEAEIEHWLLRQLRCRYPAKSKTSCCAPSLARTLWRKEDNMRMNEPSRWQHGAGAIAFAEILGKGLAVEVGHRAPKWLGKQRVAIETDVHDRFVAWNAQALRRHGVHYDETHRLEHLFEACACTAFGAGGCFVCRAVDARHYDGLRGRHVLSMTNYGSVTEPLWLIHG